MHIAGDLDPNHHPPPSSSLCLQPLLLLLLFSLSEEKFAGGCGCSQQIQVSLCPWAEGIIADLILMRRFFTVSCLIIPPLFLFLGSSSNFYFQCWGLNCLFITVSIRSKRIFSSFFPFFWILNSVMPQMLLKMKLERTTWII